MADITLISTADWDYPLWTNKQHVACSLAALGNRVLYVESLGIRGWKKGSGGAMPDWKRAISRICNAARGPRQVRPGLWVWSPLVLPGAENKLSRLINRVYLFLGLSLAQHFIGLRREYLWTYSPVILSVMSSDGYDVLVYHCVDEIQAQPCMPVAHITRWEKRLCRRANKIFVTSPMLKERLSQYNEQTSYYPNVADSRHFSMALDSSLEIPDEIARLQGQKIGFIGAISSYKLDLPLIERLAAKRSDWTFIFIGPIGEGDPSTQVEVLLKHDNVHWLGQKEYSVLPAYMKGMDVGWLPLRLNKYTDSMFPMKFFEYMSAGLPIVATRIRSLEPYSGLAFLVDQSAEGFEEAVEKALRGQGADIRQRREAASMNTYESRTKAMLAELGVIN